MGRITINAGNGLVTDSNWFENDGTVNTISMVRPFTGKNGPEPLVKYARGKRLKPGVWNYMGNYNLDHKNFIGFFLNRIIIRLKHKTVALLWPDCTLSRLRSLKMNRVDRPVSQSIAIPGTSYSGQLAADIR